MKKKTILSNWAKSILLVFALMVTTTTFASENDSITTAIDKGESGMYYATMCPNEDVAIDKDSAELFSIYIDMGQPYFMKMRVQSGKYVVKAGDCVIVKTLEPKEIPLEDSSISRSSVWSNDIVSPSEDTSAEDFRNSHPINDGEYIYLLTNMEKNGGFGFTHFTGTTMKKGNFYIVSTVEPETTGIQVVKRGGAASTSLYNLQGQRVGSPVPGQIYIKGGRKFVYRAEEVYASPVAPVMTRAAKDIEDGDPVPFLPGEAGDDDGF